ncbi:MAG: T9SS type A sorting domain-containing protein [Bacteroidota bacterium]
MKRSLLSLGMVLFLAGMSFGQLSVTSTSTNFTINFDATVSGVNNGVFNGNGFAPAPSAGQLDSDAWEFSGMSGASLSFGGTATSNDAARGSSSGGVSTGGFYAFEVSSSNFTVGVQPGGSDFTPGDLTLIVTNNTGSTVTSIDVSYNVYAFNDQPRANSFTFSHSADDVSYTDVSGLDFTSTEAADSPASWSSNARSTTISGLSLADGSSYYLRWSSDDVSGGGSRDEFALDDIVVNMAGAAASIPDLTLSGSEGWRLIASPVSTLTLNDVLGGLWTQGFTGADATAGASNVYTYDETDTDADADSGFVSVTDQSSTMGSADGYAVYVFQDDDFGTGGIQGDFPKTISFSGTAPSADVAKSFSFTSSGSASEDGWNLSGNPFGAATNVDDLNFASFADLNNFVYVYRNGAYASLDASGTVTTDTVAVGEGFFVKVDAAVSYTFPVASAPKSRVFENRNIKFALTHGDFANSATVRFHEMGAFGQENFDAYYLGSLDASYVGLYSVEDDIRLQVNSFPFDLDQELSVPLTIDGTETGTFELSWEAPTNFPSDWSLTLVDTQSDTELDLTTESSYTFEVSDIVDNRFNLVVTPAQTTVSNEEEVTVERFALDQNYPNPFNPTTNIRYTVPNSGLVNVSIYNVMGQKVATLVNTTQSAGTYTATWNAASSASGIYYYRLESAGQSITRQMTLIK